MRIKYKAPGQVLFRRFWRVKTKVRNPDGSWYAFNAAGKELFLPPGMIVIVVP